MFAKQKTIAQPTQLTQRPMMSKRCARVRTRSKMQGIRLSVSNAAKDATTMRERRNEAIVLQYADQGHERPGRHKSMSTTICLRMWLKFPTWDFGGAAWFLTTSRSGELQCSLTDEEAMYVYIYMCVSLYVYTCKNIRIRVYMCIYVIIYIYMQNICACIYTYSHMRSRHMYICGRFKPASFDPNKAGSFLYAF